MNTKRQLAKPGSGSGRGRPAHTPVFHAQKPQSEAERRKAIGAIIDRATDGGAVVLIIPGTGRSGNPTVRGK